jgi:protein-tyrosine phosphatase
LSPFTLKALEERSLVAQGGDRLPQQCALIDLQTAAHIVALNETEHRPLMLERFPYCESRTEYWHISDVELILPQIALSQIEAQIDMLLGRLPVSHLSQ